jgi:hypothetical protein
MAAKKYPANTHVKRITEVREEYGDAGKEANLHKCDERFKIRCASWTTFVKILDGDTEYHCATLGMEYEADEVELWDCGGT